MEMEVGMDSDCSFIPSLKPFMVIDDKGEKNMRLMLKGLKKERIRGGRNGEKTSSETSFVGGFS